MIKQLLSHARQLEQNQDADSTLNESCRGTTQRKGCMHALLVDAGGDVNSDPLIVAEGDRVDGVLDGREISTPIPVDVDAFHHSTSCSIAVLRHEHDCESQKKDSNSIG